LRYRRHLEVDGAGRLHRVLLEEARDHLYEHIDSLWAIDVRTIVRREDARQYRLEHVVVFFYSVKKIYIHDVLLCWLGGQAGAALRASFFPHRSLHPSNLSSELPLNLELRDLHGASSIRTGLGDEALDFTIA
jgi:hypothetical protein